MQNQKSKTKKLLVIFGLACSLLLLLGIFRRGKTAVQAAAPNQSFIDRLVERFGLNKDEVTTVMDEMRTERQQQRQAYMESRFNQAVSDEIITTDQKQALLKKYTEMEDRHNQEREEMRKWVEESGIDFDKLAPYGVGFGGKGFGRGHHFVGF
ncbi:MAG TPA: hypothetical protein VMW41_02095 [Candidatus Bathyarchaeia archaeon]|nr:hypothetical protein [Candidatus Bathyarchaeia archaeon]